MGAQDGMVLHLASIIDHFECAVLPGLHEFGQPRLQKNQPANQNHLNHAFVKLVKSAALGGCDVVISPQGELLPSADWFMADCKKRMQYLLV